MKKYLVILVLALCAAVQSNAQTTWNVRAGGGLFSYAFEEDWDYYSETGFGLMVSLETNIPFAKGSQWCISPSIIVAADLDYRELSLPMHVGYKIPVGDSGMFIPKVGPFVGYMYVPYINDDGPVIFGPSVELAYEYKHFITALNASLDVIETIGPHVFLSIGYKF